MSTVRRRSLAWLILVAALLVFANTCQVEADATERFQSGYYRGADLDALLAFRRADVLTDAGLEYGSLVVATASLVVAIWPGRLKRGR